MSEIFGGNHTSFAETLDEEDRYVDSEADRLNFCHKDAGDVSVHHLDATAWLAYLRGYGYEDYEIVRKTVELTTRDYDTAGGGFPFWSPTYWSTVRFVAEGRGSFTVTEQDDDPERYR